MGGKKGATGKKSFRKSERSTKNSKTSGKIKDLGYEPEFSWKKRQAHFFPHLMELSCKKKKTKKPLDPFLRKSAN